MTKLTAKTYPEPAAKQIQEVGSTTIVLETYRRVGGGCPAPMGPAAAVVDRRALLFPEPE